MTSSASVAREGAPTAPINRGGLLSLATLPIAEGLLRERERGERGDGEPERARAIESFRHKLPPLDERGSGPPRRLGVDAGVEPAGAAAGDASADGDEEGLATRAVGGDPLAASVPAFGVWGLGFGFGFGFGVWGLGLGVWGWGWGWG